VPILRVLRLAHLVLATEVRDVRLRIRLDRAGGVDRSRELSELRPARRILKIERRNIADHGGFGRPIERIGHEDRVAFGRETLAELAKHGAQAEDIRPDKDTGMLTGRRVDEGGIAGAVGGADIDILLDHLQLGAGDRASRRDHAGRRGQCHEVASRAVIDGGLVPIEIIVLSRHR
jgi:hypothetical protein